MQHHIKISKLFGGLFMRGVFLVRAFFLRFSPLLHLHLINFEIPSLLIITLDRENAQNVMPCQTCSTTNFNCLLQFNYQFQVLKQIKLLNPCFLCEICMQEAFSCTVKNQLQILQTCPILYCRRIT